CQRCRVAQRPPAKTRWDATGPASGGGGIQLPAKRLPPRDARQRIWHSRLGRLIRDIGRKIAGNADLEAVFVWPRSRADQIRSQQQASAAGSCIPSTLRRWSASARARPARLTNSVSSLWVEGEGRGFPGYKPSSLRT